MRFFHSPNGTAVADPTKKQQRVAVGPGNAHFIYSPGVVRRSHAAALHVQVAAAAAAAAATIQLVN